MLAPRHLSELFTVCSVLPALVVMPAMAEIPVIQSGIITGQAKGETVTQAFYFNPTTDITIKKAYFADNSNVNGRNENAAFGTILFSHEDSTVTIKDTVFENNTNLFVGGAIASYGDAFFDVSDATFKENHALYDGGAIGNYGGLNISNSTFDGNTADYEVDEDGEYTVVVEDSTAVGGGAISLGSISSTTIGKISETTFKNNRSGTYGGAIGTRHGKDGNNVAAKLDVAADFENNYAHLDGGAIYNTFYTNNGLGKGDGVTVTGDFDGNIAGRNGGAIYNDGAKDNEGKGNPGGVMTITDADFEDNNAVLGGAIFNTGVMTINGSDFERNHATGSWGGGAVYNAGIMTIDGATFEENSSEVSFGAFSSTTSANTTIMNSVFRNNTAGDVGAAGFFSNVTLTNVDFIGNSATATAKGYDGGGAVFLGAESKNMFTNIDFISNTSALRGGALSTRSGDIANNKDARLDIIESNFTGNIAATTGGAFDNYLYSSQKDLNAVYIEKTSFVENKATKGGAIYNHGLADKEGNTASLRLADGTFTANIADAQGGAIYNEAGAGMTLEGVNTFSGNIANNVANDIHNDGAIKIAGGVTTLGGGMTGAGSLEITDGATLDIGMTTLEQASVKLEGTLAATALNATEFAKINVGELVAGENAMLKLSLGTTGTYEMFGGDYGNISIEAGDLYDVTVQGKNLIVDTKSVESVIADTGLTAGAANTMIALANHDDAKVQAVSLAMQEVLATGNVDKVEFETKKMRPTEKPVAQAVSASTQNQVLSLASGRMAGGMTGRSGGDVNAEYGAWAQGLFNKAKHADQFHGYTRGIALGFDTLINNVYTLGVGYTFNNTDVHANDRDTEIDSNTLFLYGQYKPAQWYVNGTISYTMSDNTESTEVLGMLPIEASYDSAAFGAQAMVGYDFATGMTPEAGMRFLHVSQDSYHNSMGSKISTDDVNFLSAVAGLKYAFDVNSDTVVKWSPELRAAMTYDIVSEESHATIVIPGTVPYTVAGENLSRVGGEFGIGLTAHYMGLEVSLNYDLDLHKDYTSQTGMVRFRYDF